MAKLTITRGISGSGKSTWARQQNATVVSRDAIRDMLFPIHLNDSQAYFTQDREVVNRCEDNVTMVEHSMIAGLLKGGQDVIVDNTSIEWKFVKKLAKIGYRYGAEVEVKVFDIPARDAIIRDAIRKNRGGRSVGAEVINKQHERFKHTKSKTLEPVFAPEPYIGTPGKPKAFLVDIDGTLAHMGDKRGPFEWHNVGVDELDQTISNIVWDLWAGSQERSDGHYTVIVMSGRDEVCRKETAYWLDVNAVPYERLFMRPQGDTRPDNIIKAELFDKYVRDNYDVQFVLDDRDQVVEMWRRMGLKVLQVDEGDF